MMGWVIAGAFGVGAYLLTRKGEASSDVGGPLLWTGTVGDVKWTVGALGRTAFSWHVKIPASGNLPARDLEGAEPDLGAAIKAAIRTSIEEGGSHADGNISASRSAGASIFDVRRGQDGWTWSVASKADKIEVSGISKERGQAVLDALDQLGRISSL